ncbi:hypothetical protein CBR_g30486 [Chara braunii]|uniref:Myb-like domain-containing protein n=1 Tax=Chara braunii TaxID=69332 RepID=A0A388LCS9_CHABU|nr:hypothetical protein CBR_g30486 [Chara braunii]|eukprot:GBG80119.1 hypothetical protein CBR_g30486 [Chara braunii]
MAAPTLMCGASQNLQGRHLYTIELFFNVSSMLWRMIHAVEDGDFDSQEIFVQGLDQQLGNSGSTPPAVRGMPDEGGMPCGVDIRHVDQTSTRHDVLCSELGNASGGSKSISVGKAVAEAAAPAVAEAVAPAAASGSVDGGKKKKVSNRWGEMETTMLLRRVYEVKTNMGENSEAMGIAPLKQRLWRDVSERMKEARYNREDEDCKNRFHSVCNNYRLVKDHNRWSGNQKYWSMDQATRKANSLDFMMRRDWYDIINVHEVDKDTINPNSLTDPGAGEHNMDNVHDTDVEVGDDDAEEEEAVEDGSAIGGGSHTGGSGGGAEPPLYDCAGGGAGTSVPGQAGASTSASGGSTSSATVTETLGRRKRCQQNARELAMRAVTEAMRDHTSAQTRSDITHHQILREQLTIQDRAAKLTCEVMREDIASRSSNSEKLGERLEKGYAILADAICSLGRKRARSPNAEEDE